MTTRLFEVAIGDRAIRVGALRFEQHGARQHSTFTYDDTPKGIRPWLMIEPA